MFGGKEMVNFSIDKVKDKQGDVKRNIETKKGELSQLEKRKEELLDSGIDIQDSDMDEATKRLVMEQINQAIEENSEKGKELSSEMNGDVDSLKELKDDVERMSESTEQERKKLERKKSILEKFGLGKNLDSAFQKMEESESNLESLNGSLLQDEKELSEISQRLSML